jgi:isopentenyl-diphosphate delta-isomerase
MQEEELFETYTPDGEPLGRLPRSRVHAEGFWHKSTHVFLFDGAGRLWVQRRAAHKDICGGLWDYSVGEHLKPGEGYLEAAHRGLEEELGLRDVVLVRFGGLERARNELPDLGIHDYELQQAFKGVHDGPLAPDPSEVAAVQAVPLAALAAWVAARPDEFTPWFRRDLVTYRILG